MFSKRNLSSILDLCFDGNYFVEWNNRVRVS